LRSGCAQNAPRYPPRSLEYNLGKCGDSVDSGSLNGPMGP
jgi:hypothetical protein